MDNKKTPTLLPSINNLEQSEETEKKRTEKVWGAAPHVVLENLMKTGWAKQTIALPTSPKTTRQRRQQLLDAYNDATIFIPAGQAAVRAHDTMYRYRAGSDFLYLVGQSIQGAILELSGNNATLWVSDSGQCGDDSYWKDSDRGGLWVGPQATIAEIEEATGVTVQTIKKPTENIGNELTMYRNSRQDHLGVASVKTMLADMRLIKDPYELSEIEQAVKATITGFGHLVSELEDGVTEAWLEGTFSRTARTCGYDNGYLPIVGSGERACVLHWTNNTGQARSGDMVLVDAGVERFSGYTADITRTLPVDGHYSTLQRHYYDAVVKAHSAALGACQPGNNFADPHKAATLVLVEFLRDEKLLSGSIDEILETQTYRRYTLHGTSHMLGIDVHDCASATPDLYRGALQPNMVLTVEPGLYFQPHDETIPKKLRGIGIRIEDDIAITTTGHRNLSHALPVKSDDIETWQAQQRP